MFVDSDEDGTFDASEYPLPGRTVYLDQNQNGVLDVGEIAVTTGPAGDYVFQHLLANTPDTPYYVAQYLPPGWEETTAPTPTIIGEGELRADQDFGTVAVAEVSTYTQSSPKTLGNNRTVIATLNVTDSHTILDLNVTIDITHANDEDLSATLISPAHTSFAVLPGWRNRRQLYRHHVRRPGHNADLSRYRPGYGQLHPRFAARRPGERKCQRNMESRNS